MSSPAPILWAGARLFSSKFLMSLHPRDYLKPGPDHRAAYGPHPRQSERLFPCFWLLTRLTAATGSRQTKASGIGAHASPHCSLPPALSHHRIRVVAKLTTTSLQSRACFVLFCFEDRISRHDPGCSGTFYVDQAVLKLTEIPLPPECWDYRRLHQARLFLLYN